MLPTVKVLIVTDDWGNGLAGNGGFLRWQELPWFDATKANLSREFHLGEFTDTLVKTKWVGFELEITKAHRTTVAEYQSFQINEPTGDNLKDEAALKANRGADVVGFRFNKEFLFDGKKRKLADYDMALFFSISPESNPKTQSAELLAEAEAVATFMENGGGFFATGDHENLGAYLCGLIPRVRSMRRWWFGQNPADMLPAAPGTGAERHDTTQNDHKGEIFFENQSDNIPQTIIPKLYEVIEESRFLKRMFLPHPVLCTPMGVMDVLPDHMHEGECDVPDNLSARTYKIAGQARREYPDITLAGGKLKPLSPEVIATASVSANIVLPTLDNDKAHTPDTAPALSETFGAIGVWDGHRVGQGRVIVDSTFHHFFDINISGDKYLDNEIIFRHKDLVGLNSKFEKDVQKLYGFFDYDRNLGWVPNDAYKKIQHYYRNIVYWLIPANRTEFIQFSAIKSFASRPTISKGLSGIRARLKQSRPLPKPLPDIKDLLKLENLHVFDDLDIGVITQLGQITEDYFRRTRGYCYAYYAPNIPEKLPRIPWYEWIQRATPGQNEQSRQFGELETIGIVADRSRVRSIAWGVNTLAAIVSLEIEDGSDFKRNEESSLRIYQAVGHILRNYVQGKFAAIIGANLKAFESMLEGSTSLR